MQCENCGEREAEIHLTKIIQNELTTVHLCDECAEDEGVAAESAVGNAPLTDFLAEMGKDVTESMLSTGSEDCPYCGTSASDFRKTGRLGCPQCYAHFEEQLRSLLRRIHGSTQHVGKLYLSEVDETDDEYSRLAALKRRLQQAIQIEDFEAAADLRDRIDELKVAE